MEFAMFLLVFTAMGGFKALCQDVIDSQVPDTNLAANSGNVVKSADVKSQPKTTMLRGGHCACPQKSRAQGRCQCRVTNGISKKERDLCIKEGIRKYKNCKSFLLKTKKKSQSIVIPI